MNVETISATDEKPDEPLINWTSVNSYTVRKTFSWYLTLITLTAAIAIVVYLITKDKVTSAVLLVSGILIAIYAGKKPKVVNYQLTRNGFTVNGKYYEFSSFRSFAIIHQGVGASAVLTPLKRFLPYSYIYFERDLEDQIATALSEVLPFEDQHTDSVESFLRRIGF